MPGVPRRGSNNERETEMGKATDIFGQAIAEAIEERVGELVQEALDGLDLHDEVETAVEEYDFSNAIEEAIRDADIPGTVETAVQEEMEGLDIANAVDLAIDALDLEDKIAAMIADRLPDAIRRAAPAIFREVLRDIALTPFRWVAARYGMARGWVRNRTGY